MRTEETTRGAGKPRRERLTRERVIAAAVRIMDEAGLDALTMRRIGRELGVEAMSLYNHVRDKEDILDGICEHVLAQFRVADVEDWAEAARLGAREYRRLLRDHPNVIILMTERKGAITNPESLRAYEFALDVFHRAGLSGAEAVKVFHAFGGYILGFVTLELGLMLGGDDEEHREAHEQMARLVGSADLPRMREALPHFVDCDDDEQFEFGLDLLIEGLRTRVAPTG
ncbi:MAG: TetR/AcrR family transcriptional regulator C-terminal domain-containing protein [Actinomycetota bacterium]